MTGDWGAGGAGSSEGAAGGGGDDDEVYGDFEDLQTGSVREYL